MQHVKEYHHHCLQHQYYSEVQEVSQCPKHFWNTQCGEECFHYCLFRWNCMLNCWSIGQNRFFSFCMHWTMDFPPNEIWYLDHNSYSASESPQAQQHLPGRLGEGGSHQINFADLLDLCAHPVGSAQYSVAAFYTQCELEFPKFLCLHKVNYSIYQPKAVDLC